MRLSRLALRHFRNLGSQELELPAEGVALIGDNAQGKSNFLEAIYYLETFRSFRGARDEQLVGFGEDVFRVVGDGSCGADEVGDRVQVAAAFERRGKRKKISVDGNEPERIGDALGRLSAVIFSPADVELVSGGPKDRRRFLDIVLSLNEPGYVSALQDYKRILARRNASLKEGHSASVVTAWDDGLARAGAQVIGGRRTWIQGGSDSFGDYYARVSNDARARMTYRSSVDLGGAKTAEEIQTAFHKALSESTGKDRRLGTTTVGPHRDDVLLRLDGPRDGLDLRDYGSGGQRRTAALALRLVEARTIRERRGAMPLMLLDDVFAELDGGRSERVLELMEAEETGQVVLTAPRESDVRVKKDALARWHISAGVISS
ncbi:MAG: DNA replication and repair protein RecF [Gemmatimonadota bacterium]|nr:DNA replication and repair protein RecF [Gemmatimonadota bacterium]MDH3421647.1 DNA replication and repair protein RecF [Gemmatimonadota bacterium]